MTPQSLVDCNLIAAVVKLKQSACSREGGEQFANVQWILNFSNTGDIWLIF